MASLFLPHQQQTRQDFSYVGTPSGSDDPSCVCHFRYPTRFPKLEAVVCGPETGQIRELHQDETQLDVAFDAVGNRMLINEHYPNPVNRCMSVDVSLILKAKYVQFVNLEGLSDHSLLLTLRIGRTASAVRGNKMILKEKVRGFFECPPYMRLLEDVYECRWPEKFIQIRLPEKRCKRWKTVALILKAFNQITSENYCQMAGMMMTPRVGGLDVRAIQREIKARKEKGKGLHKVRRQEPVSARYKVAVSDADKIERVNQAYAVHLMAFINSSPFTPREYNDRLS
ncbi:hypothetical protein BP00DRAFT_429862 [Aspergillus indologenus CBS 114.80]|uniref:Uncharacterized protein n=1 Tax=Aspergillus indologenus CBS 114.80 TaxID=1450541 RepID=A0A2V5IEH2_9EURO|nr:hypothetical protein BP00DRAFT_429862 [Aspergillus indologenus CBS 114.80]